MIALAEVIETGKPPSSLADYSMPPAWRSTIDEIRETRKNLLVVGGTSSGKTTFLRAFLRDILARKLERIVSIEDTPELNLGHSACVALLANGRVTQLRLVKVTMRLRPDRIAVGEVRDEAAEAMIQAFGTGHPGCCTVHGGSIMKGLTRLQQLSGMDVGMIADIIDYAILMERNRVTGERAPTDFARISHADKHFIPVSIGRG